MNDHWYYVAAAYALTIAGTAGLFAWAWSAMRRAERQAEDLSRPNGPFVPSEVEGRGAEPGLSTALDTNGVRA